MEPNFVKPHFLSMPCPIIKGSVCIFRHTNGHMAVDVVEALNTSDPFITSQLHGILHRENLTRQMVVFTNDFPAHPGDKILYDGLIYRCDETFKTKYNVSRGKKLFTIPHHNSHKVVFTLHDLVHDIPAQDLFEMYRGVSLEGKLLKWKYWDAGHNKFRLERCK